VRRGQRARRKPCPVCGRPIATGGPYLTVHLSTHERPIDVLRASTPETRARIVREYHNGATMDELAERYYMARSSVWLLLHREGARVRPKHSGQAPLSSEDLLTTAELVGRGMSQRQVADVLGLSQSTVSYRLDRAGVRIRGVRSSRKRAHAQSAPGAGG
jgi:transposase-like protein